MAITNKNYKKRAVLSQMENIKNLIVAYEKNPNGYCYMTGASGLYIKSVVEALQDIKTRQSLDAMTKADALLLSIIASDIHPNY